MPRPLLALVAILKDEQASVRALLESALPFCEHVTIVDTGSTDDTQQLIADVLREHGGDLDRHIVVEEPFKPFAPLGERIIDFAATRNMALKFESERKERTEPAVFTLFLSGDETLHGGAELRAYLEKHRDGSTGAYCVTMQRDLQQWPYARILRTDAKWCYRFPIHETPVGPDGETMGPTILGVRVVYAPPKDDKRLLERHKNVDLPVLQYLAAQKPVTHEEHISRARALLFLAQTHEMLALEHDKDDPGSEWMSHQYAAMGYYQRRALLEGDPSDAHYSLLHYYDVAERLKLYSHEEMITRFTAFAEIDPERPEIRYKLALHAGQVDARLASGFAMDAVKVAREAKTKPLPFSTDLRIEWLSLQIAAECAAIMKMPDRAKKLAAEGLAAGGPAAAFSAWI